MTKCNVFSESWIVFFQRFLSKKRIRGEIFDEILVNAADNKQRDPSMSLIKIDIDPKKNRISVYNNGKGIPVEMHKDEKMFVPTMIFGVIII